ncbi:MAG: MBL fold metallo-hydrolase RNA specificity domain-containing protein [Thermoplasmatota archaeon]
MVEITCYGGVGEIGGNKIILSQDDQRIILDWGMSFGKEGKYFEEFLQPRTNSILQDYLTLDLTPALDGIYREDMLSKKYAEEAIDDEDVISHLWGVDIDSYQEYIEKNGRPFVDGILLSHAHVDHSAYLGLLDENIPIHTSDTTKELLELLDDLGSMGVSKEVIEPGKFYLDKNQGGLTPGANKIDKKSAKRKIIQHHDQEEFDIEDYHIKIFSVDHSVPGASSFLIHTPDDKKIAYTGDIRFHGKYSDGSKEFVESAAKEDIDVLITEGTRIEEEQPDDEEKVEQDMIDLIQKTEGAVFVGFSWKDITRYQTVLEAAKKTGRTFVISPKTAYLCRHLDCDNEIKDPEDEEDVSVYLARTRNMLYSPADYKWDKYTAGYEADWDDGVDLTHLKNGIKAPEIAKEPDKYIVFMDFYNIKELLDLGPMPDSIYIRAQSEPFNEEMELSERRLCNWLKKFDINEENDYRPYQIHASGHASGPEIAEMIENISPETVIPVHTVRPDVFEECFSDKSISVILPEYGNSIEI